MANVIGVTCLHFNSFLLKRSFHKGKYVTILNRTIV